MRESLEEMVAHDGADLGTTPIDDVRALRTELTEAESGVSYLRRLAQGRLDVIAAETARREEGGDDSIEELISRLPNRLAGSTRSPGVGRPPQSLDPGSVDPDLATALDEIIARHNLDSLGELTDEELWTAEAELTEFERRVSDIRQRLFRRIDAVEAEIVRRYSRGDLSVDELL